MNSNSNKITFECEPLVEVAVGVQFAKLADFKAPDLETLWQSFGKDKYPKYQEVEILHRITPEQDFIINVNVGTELPRIWFLGQDESKLIQFQKDRFLYNWRKIETDNNNSYPRYNKVIENFFEHYKELNNCLHTLDIPSPVLEKLELNYVNIIPLKGAISLQNISDVFTNVTISNDLPIPDKLNMSWQFTIPENNASLSVHIVTAKNIKNGEDVIKLEIAVNGNHKEHDTMRNWFDISHDWIIKTFTTITTPKIQNIWGKV